MKKYLLLIVVVIFSIEAYSQTTDKRTWNWYFGGFAAIQFTSQSQPPIILTGSAMTANEGSSALSDSAGNLLCYTNGQSVWDANNMIMPNGTGLKGHYWSAQSGLLVPMPGSNTLYYLFTVNNWSDAATELNYSVIDRTMNNGWGDVTSQKNVLVNSNCREQLTAVYHSNGEDIWIISHEYGQNYVAYLLTAQGLNTTPVISPVGAVNDGWNRYGYLKVSPYCNKIASALGGQGFITQDTSVQVCDFDNTTGIVSNPVFVADFIDIPSAYGCEFSPDNTKLYVTEFNGPNIYQYDLTAANIPSTKMNVASLNNGNNSSLAAGPDGKIYVSKQGYSQLGAIDFPNLAGLACNYNDAEVILTTGANTIGSCNFFRSCSSTTGIVSIDYPRNYLNVFPNPANDVLTAQSFCAGCDGLETKCSIKISDLAGRIIYETDQAIKNNGLNSQINVSGFSTGIYFLRLEMDGNVFTRKVTIE